MRFSNPYYNHNPIPEVKFKEIQIDEEKYISLQEKIESFFNGSMPSSDDNLNQDFDQEEGEWTDPDPNNYDPTNSIEFDELDALQMSKELADSISVSKENVSDSVQSLKRQADSIQASYEKERNLQREKAINELIDAKTKEVTQ